jgi:hypothetical protein
MDMPKKDNHIAKTSKLARFRSFQEMKADPPAFPSTRTPAQLHAERKEVIDQLRVTYSPGKSRLKKNNKKK